MNLFVCLISHLFWLHCFAASENEKKTGYFDQSEKKDVFAKNNILPFTMPSHRLSIHIIHNMVLNLLILLRKREREFLCDWAYVIFKSVNLRSRFICVNFTIAMTFAFVTCVEICLYKILCRPHLTFGWRRQKCSKSSNTPNIKYILKVIWYIHLRGLVGNHLWLIWLCMIMSDLQRIINVFTLHPKYQSFEFLRIFVHSVCQIEMSCVVNVFHFETEKTQLNSMIFVQWTRKVYKYTCWLFFGQSDCVNNQWGHAIVGKFIHSYHQFIYSIDKCFS